MKGNTAEGGTSDELARGSGWVEMVGEMAMVSVASNDQVTFVFQLTHASLFKVSVFLCYIFVLDHFANKCYSHDSRVGNFSDLAMCQRSTSYSKTY